MESQESLLYNYMPSVKIRAAIPKLCQVQHEINIEISLTFCQYFADFVLLNSISLKPLNRFFHRKEETLIFHRCIKIIIPMQINDF